MQPEKKKVSQVLLTFKIRNIIKIDWKLCPDRITTWFYRLDLSRYFAGILIKSRKIFTESFFQVIFAPSQIWDLKVHLLVFLYQVLRSLILKVLVSCLSAFFHLNKTSASFLKTNKKTPKLLCIPNTCISNKKVYLFLFFSKDSLGKENTPSLSNRFFLATINGN